MIGGFGDLGIARLKDWGIRILRIGGLNDGGSHN